MAKPRLKNGKTGREGEQQDHGEGLAEKHLMNYEWECA
ncbi:hypothetical protein DSM3645_18361 [Blastopirellula marina DSM 3645]|uniref:Uncharacterized protein n=1 Tax=Blastopirellula marina DSM 3645 TaxID=314230 RepID=A3ZYW6_9BACT|nr:hypothetical protein DSM3645_18361 [Blastopirellula marina DSM 3645]